MQNMPIGIFRGDDTDAFSYQTIVGTINTDLDLTGCRAVFRYLDFSMEFDPIPDDRKLTIVIPADETKKFPPGLGYASLRVYDSEDRLKTFSNRIMVFVATKTPMFGSDEFEVDFNVRATLEPLKFFVGPNPDDFDEYRGYVEKVIDKAGAEKYGLAILLDAIDSDLGAADGVAATPVAVKAAYAAIIDKLTDDYYTAEQTDEAIDRVAAYYITYDATGNPFPTYAALANAQTVYSGGQVRTPTRNDYCVVLADETHDNAEYRYIYAVAEGQTTGSWQPQFPVEGVMTVDPTVTRNSQNPVSGGGVWSAIWGALSALPTGFSSLYDWVVAQLAGKEPLLTPLLISGSTIKTVSVIVKNGSLLYPIGIPTSDMRVNGKALSSDVTLDADDVGALPSTTDGSNRYVNADVHFTGGGGDIDLPLGGTGTLTYLPSYESTTQNNLAAWKEGGGLADSGKKPSDFQSALTAQQLANIAAVSDALAFDATHSYAAGDPVVYNGTLYTFTSEHTGAWTGSDVSAVDIIARLAGKANSDGPTITSGMTVEGSIYAERIYTQSNQSQACYGPEAIELPSGGVALLPTLAQGNSDTFALNGNIPYTLTTKTINNGAVTLDDRAINAVAVSSSLASLTVNFPTATSGKARDFGLRLTVASGITTAPELALPQGVVCENADGEAPEIGADGAATILYFTETASGVFLVKGEVLQTITQA